MLALVSSVVALLLGPAVVAGARRWRPAVAAVDAFVLVAIGGLVFLHVLPHSIGHGGWRAVVAAVVGLFLPVVGEHAVFHGRGRLVGRRALVALALVGLAVHAFLDGTALVGPVGGGHADGHHHESLLALGVVLHRLPIGVAIWAAARPRHGLPAAVGLLAIIIIATLGGYFVGGTGLSELSLVGLSVFQALVAGSLVHVILTHPLGEVARAGPEDGLAWSGFLGAALAVATLVVAGSGHAPDAAHAQGLGLGDTFLTLALESAPALLIAFVAAGLLQAVLRPAVMAWLGRGGRLGQALRGMVFGLPLPICSCGVVPLYRSLVASGAPATAAFAFLIATPEIGIDAFLLSLPLLGAELATVRLAAAAAVALAVALAVGALAGRPALPAAPAAAPEAPLPRRLRAGLRFGLVELFDDIIPWVLAGLLVAALAEPLLAAEWLAALPAGVDVLLFALLGLPVYVCASGATPVVAVLLWKGISPGAAIAFLLAGPATNLTTFGVVSGLYGRRVGLAFGAAVAAAAVAAGFAVNAALPGARGLDLARAAAEPPSAVQWLSLAALAALLAGALLRRGPRRLLAEVVPGAAGHTAAPHDHAAPDPAGAPAAAPACGCHDACAAAPAPSGHP